jgi:hypothetical protein
MSLGSAVFAVENDDPISRIRQRDLSPEQDLMLAVLSDAITLLHGRQLRTLAGYTKNQNIGVAVARTRRWVQSNDTSWPFSFVNVCETLGLSVSCVRRSVGQDGAKH